MISILTHDIARSNLVFTPTKAWAYFRYAYPLTAAKKKYAVLENSTNPRGMVLLIIIETAPSISKTRPHRTTIISMRKLLYLSVRFLRISTRHAMDMIIKKTEADSNDTLYSFISDAIIHARDHRHSQQRNPPSHNYMIFPVKIYPF